MNFHIDIFLYFLKFFGVQLLNNVVLVSAEQQSISVICVYVFSSVQFSRSVVSDSL